MIRTVGFPRMHKEPGEKRVFLPAFVAAVAATGVTVLLESGYGEEIGLRQEAYRQEANTRAATIRFVPRVESFAADLVIVLRSPERNEFSLLKPGAVLVSMLHFPTRSWRVQELRSRGVGAVAMDQITNDDGVRLVQNLSSVAWNGLEAAFAVLETTLPGFMRTDGKPVQTTILGTGEIGRIAVDAATRYGSRERNEKMILLGHPGAVALALGRNVTGRPETIAGILTETDILVDATQRRDPSVPVVPNDWISFLPGHAVIADLSVDPYLLDDTPPVVRGIEGIPRGNLDRYTFFPGDTAWDETVPEAIPSRYRRAVVSCYSWPGIHPEACMDHYGHQLEPLMTTLIQSGYEGLSAEGGYFERALFRGSLRAAIRIDPNREM